MTSRAFCCFALAHRGIRVTQSAAKFDKCVVNARMKGNSYVGSRQPSMEEHFDVLDTNGLKTGERVARSIVHREGLWHRSTHIWVVSRARRALLLQLRSASKDTFPGRWDVSAAGHLSAGDDSVSAASRELYEELGLNEGTVEYLFTARAEAHGETAKTGPFIDREFQDVYIFRPSTAYSPDGEVSQDDIRLQQEEVDQVKYWPLEEFEEGLRSRDKRFVPRSDDYVAKFLPIIKQQMN